MVGDAKQSIYRFRRADIGMYDDVKELITAQGGAVVALQQNFRTVGSIVHWANGVFSELMPEPALRGLQPAYDTLTATRADPGAEPGVVIVRPADAPRADDQSQPKSGPKPKAKPAELCRREARLLAGLLADIGRTGWQVHDPGDGWRPATPGDVAILLPTFTHVGHYELALREAGLPYRVDGGRTFYGRREVLDTLAVLRALDSAADPVAVYGALHGQLFAFSDDRLYEFHAAGGRFDYVDGAAPEGYPEIAAALADLRVLHELRNARPPADTIDDLVRRTSLFESLALWADDPEQAIANVAELVSLADEFAHSTEASFHAFVAKMAARRGRRRHRRIAGRRERRLRAPHDRTQGQGPRVSHRRAGGRHAERARRRTRPAGRSRGPPAALRPLLPVARPGPARHDRAPADGRLRPALHARKAGAQARTGAPALRRPHARGRPAGAAAPRRRARSRLAAGHPAGKPGGRPGDRCAGPCARRGRRGRRRRSRRRPRRPPPIRWRRARRGARSASRSSRGPRAPRRSSRRARSSVSKPPDWSDRPASTPIAASAPAGRAHALALGSAVHAVLEHVSLHDDARLDELAAQAAAAAGLGGEAARVAALARACWRAAPLRAAARGVCHRELPVCVSHGEALIEGAIDLVYRDDELGGWVVVDYKTDARTAPDAVRERYGGQAGRLCPRLRGGERRAAWSSLAVLLAALPDADGAANGRATCPSTTGCASSSKRALRRDRAAG